MENTIDKMNDEISNLRTSLKDLTRRYSDLSNSHTKLMKCVEFYASFENYASDDINMITGNDCYDIILHDFDRNLNGSDYAGSLARRTLKELKNTRLTKIE